MKSLRTVGKESRLLIPHANPAPIPLAMRSCAKPVILFRVGDCAFLMTVGAESGAVMQALHELEWNFLLLSVVGMGAAMAVQMLLAFALSPLLGSIETMAPSMVVAMVVPMLVDAGELAGWMIQRSDAALVGAAFGLAYFVYLQWYAAAVRRRMARTWPIGAAQP